MSNFWRAKKPASELTIEEHVTVTILGGILANPRIDKRMPPEVIVEWCKGVADEYMGREFGPKGTGSGSEVIAEYEKETGKSIVDLINERLEAVRNERQTEGPDAQTDGDNS